MGAINEQWLRLLDHITERGQRDAAAEAALPTDAGLWAMARQQAPLLLPAEADPDLVDQLFDAYNEARRPTRFNMYAVAAWVAAAGLHAVVESTTGNTATLFAGKAPARWTVKAGSGWFVRRSSDGTFPPIAIADTSEFSVGANDDDETPTVPVPSATTPYEVAQVVIQRVKGGPPMTTPDGRAHPIDAPQHSCIYFGCGGLHCWCGGPLTTYATGLSLGIKPGICRLDLWHIPHVPYGIRRR
ncbi:hypothetical protein KBX50_08315 [Micromonospora sp. C51]|uniref:hypothetical protein n=1 Tax=Micromonospora sp. C51 TaxID=2824879 RepID=UPI001B38CB54|nr:hypothetical protein [Micromonospora sp. C51]MBQ1048468.1 hypothetical protein [Micromonospora sp. C51]